MSPTDLPGIALTILNRYMLGRLMMTTAGIMAVVTIEELLQHSAPLYLLVASGGFSLGRLLELWCNILPLIFYHSTPEIVSIAILYQYYRWSDNNEIVILRNMGMSSLQVAWPAIVAIILFTLFCGINSLYLMSPAWSRVEDIRASAVGIFDPDLLQAGKQQEILRGVSIEFAGRQTDGDLQEVLLFDARGEVGFRLVWAETGRFIKTGSTLVLRIEKGTYHVRDGDKLTTAQFDDMSIPVLAGAFLGEKISRERGFYERGIVELLNPPEWIRGYRPLYGQWLAEGHYRIVAPLQCLGNGILVLGLLIPGFRNRSTQLCRMLLALISAVATAVLPIPLIPLVSNHLEFLPNLYLLAALPAAAGTALLILGDRPRRKQRSVGRLFERRLAEKPLSGRA